MLNHIHIFVAWGLILICAGIGTARTLYVSPVGTNDYMGYYSNWLGAATTISAAVSRASSGDSVFVTNTTYLLTSNIVVSAGITLRSWNNGNLDQTNTVLDGQHLVRCLHINHTNALVAGFTITNGVGTGSVSSVKGGGVYIGSAAGGGGCFSNCIVTGNSASDYGGGIYVLGDTLGDYAMVTDCEIRGNVITDTGGISENGGGGIYVYGGHVRNCTITGNTCQYTAGNLEGGGGILVSASPYTSVRGCIITNNTSMWCGGGVFLQSTVGPFVSNTVSHNTAPMKNGGGLYLYRTSSNLVISACTISDNTCGGDTANAVGGGGLSMVTIQLGEGGLITNCVIRNNAVTNSSNASGGGIYVSSAKTNNITVADCTISGNSIPNSTGAGAGGGGIRIMGGALIKNCVISNNWSVGYYGGVWLMPYTGLSQYPEIRNCLISGNNANVGGGGIRMYYGTAQNCTIAHNTSAKGGGIWFQTQAYYTNTICYFNTAPIGANWYIDTWADTFSYGCITPTNGLVGNGSITNDPLFVDKDDNFRLLPSSPCINTGANQDWMNSAVDLDWRPRLDRFSGRVDMGCYEHIRQGMVFMVY